MDQHVHEAAVAKSLLLWGHRNRLAMSLGIKPIDFVRQKLDQLQLGKEMVQFRYGARLYALPLPGD